MSATADQTPDLRQRYYAEGDVSAVEMYWFLNGPRPGAGKTTSALTAVGQTARGKAGRRARAEARRATSAGHRDGRRLRAGELDPRLYDANGLRKPAR